MQPPEIQTPQTFLATPLDLAPLIYWQYVGQKLHGLKKSFSIYTRPIVLFCRRSDIHAVVTVGSGKFYSNGLDLKWWVVTRRVSVDDFDAAMKLWHQTFKRLLLFPVPTVASINGNLPAKRQIAAYTVKYVLICACICVCIHENICVCKSKCTYA